MNKNVQDFVIETIQSIASKIPGISIRYAYDIQTNFHIVEVSPESIRRGREEYMEMEYLLWKNFKKNFRKRICSYLSRTELTTWKT